MPYSKHPRHILVQVASDDALTSTLAERLVDMVDTALRDAYPRASVTVILDHSVDRDKVAVVAADPDAHEDLVHKIVEDARAMLCGDPEPH